MKKKPDKDPTRAHEDDMRLLIDAPVSQRQIPTDLELRLGQVPGVGTRVTATLQISREALTFNLTDGTRAADLDVGGIFYNDKGKPLTSFVGRLRILPLPENLSPSKRSRAIYDFDAWLPAGLYQVRVAYAISRAERSAALCNGLRFRSFEAVNAEIEPEIRKKVLI